jgi:S-adenosylmethionine/arginine decarboxylase-like enzyme
VEVLLEVDNSTSGRHFIFTGFVRSEFQDLLNDPDYLAQMLHDLIGAVDMKILVPANMVKVEIDENKANGDEDCGGVTGTAILSTSHISIHTWPLHNRVSFDLYSCKDFNTAKVMTLLTERIGICGGDVVSLSRKAESKDKIRWTIV